MEIIETLTEIIFYALALNGAAELLESFKTPEKLMKYVKILLFSLVAYAAIAFINANANAFLWPQSDRVFLVICWIFIVAFSHVKWTRFFKEDNGSVDNDDFFLGI